MAIKRFNISAQEPALDKDGKFTLFWYNLFNRLAEFGGGTFVQSVGASSPLTSTGGDTPVIGLGDSAVTPGTYGDATHVGQFTVDQKGLLQFAQNVEITGTGLEGYWTPITNGSASTPEILFDSNGDCIVGFVPTP